MNLRCVMVALNRITVNLAILGGRNGIRGTRIAVSVIVKRIAHGATRDEVLADYADLEPEDVQEALDHAAWLAEDEVRMA
jgi:uncharacterized protein (DUF433 family)